jgi:hypothetical protein
VTSSGLGHQERDFDLGWGKPAVIAAKALVESGGEDHLLVGGHQQDVADPSFGFGAGIGAE